MASLHARARLVLAALLTLVTLAAAAPSSASAFSNGRAPAHDLARIYHPSLKVYLRKDAAAAFNTMVLAAVEAKAAVPYVGGPLSAYRNIAGQVLLRQQWCAVGRCANAAVPGTSNHGLGIAIDLANPARMRPWIDRHGGQFGWAKRWSDAPWESWHLRYRAHVWHHHPDPGPNPASPILRRGSGGPGQAYWVRQVQRAVGVHVDGHYGAGTARAVARFRKAHHLSAGHGVVTAAAWAKIRNPGPPTTDRPTRIPLPHPKPTPAPRPAPASVLDISVYQGAVDYVKVAHAGIRAIVAKASEGVDYVDPTWTAGRVRAIRSSGMLVGTYHFLRPRPGRDARAEARFAVKTARGGGWRPRKDLPLAEDLENTKLDWCATARYGLAFAREVRTLTGRYPILYSYPGFLNAMPTSCRAQLGVLKLWIAHYGVKTPIVPSPWSNATGAGYTAWQYTSTASIPGVHGHVDVSLFPGGVPALTALASAR